MFKLKKHKKNKFMNHKIIKKALLIRNVEQAFLDLFSGGNLNGTVHTCIGQELSAIAFAGQLSKKDFVFSNHRCHGHYMEYTNEWKPLILELLGKKKGVCGGIGSSQHLQKFNFYSNGIQGGIMPMGAGYALANKLSFNNNIGVVYIGDGTLGEGVVYETLNFISKKDIPMIVVCENNKYAQSTPIEYNLSGTIKGRAQAFGIEYRESSTFGDDLEIIDEAKSSIDWVRKNNKPLFHLVNTYRLKAHSKGDDDRDVKEIEDYEKLDFLNILREKDPDYYNKQNLKIKSEVSTFIEEALLGEELSINDYTGDNNTSKNKISFEKFTQNKDRFIKKINSSFLQILENEKVVFIGEDILDPYGGAFKVSKGLSDKYPERVIGTSISEGLIAGVANGLALNGFKPFAEFMFGDFTALAFDQMLNHAAKVFNMYNKKVFCPVVFRTPMGGGRGYGPTHSQTLEKHFLGMDTFEIYATNRYVDPGLILNHAYNRIHPTLIIENKVDYGKNAILNLPEGYVAEISNEALPSLLVKPLNTIAKTTIISYGGLAGLVIDNINDYFYEHESIVQVLILTQIDPIPENLLKLVIKDSKNIIFVEEGVSGGSVGDYFISWIAQNFSNKNLKSISSKRFSIPSVKSLEEQILTNKNDIFKKLEEINE
jgi:2-oxoisovalerate dehydrogenase E1 component